MALEVKRGFECSSLRTFAKMELAFRVQRTVDEETKSDIEIRLMNKCWRFLFERGQGHRYDIEEIKLGKTYDLTYHTRRESCQTSCWEVSCLS